MAKTKNRKEFGEGLIFIITNYILWFVMGNIYFLLLNLPFVYVLFAILLNGNNKLPGGFSILFLLCCIPIGPAVTALLSVMGKLIREKDVNLTKDFFKAYKENFFQALYFWSIGIFMIGLLSFDIRYLIDNNYPSILAIILYIVIAIIIIMGLYIFPIISRFYLKFSDILKFSAYYAVKKIHTTIMNLFSFAIIGFLFYKGLTFVLIFVSSVICFLIMFYEQTILLEIEEKIKTDNNPDASSN